MSAWLRWLGTIVLALGLGVAGYAATRAAGEAAKFAEMTDLYERHEDHPLFQAQYYPAAVRHYGLIGGAVGAALGGIVFGSLLIGLGAVVGRLPPRED